MKKLVKESLNEFLGTLQENKDKSESYNKLVSTLQKASIPCKVKLLKDDSIYVELGFDYPDELMDKVWDIADKIRVPDVEIAAETSDWNVLKSEKVAGGPRRYMRR